MAGAGGVSRRRAVSRKRSSHRLCAVAAGRYWHRRDRRGGSGRACGNSSYDLRPFFAILRQHLPSWMPLATLQNCSSLIPSRVIHIPIGSDNSRLSRRATPQGVISSSAGRRPRQPTFCRATLRTTTAFTAGCGLVRRSVGSPGNTGSLCWRRATVVPHEQSGSAATRHGAPQGSPLLV